MTSDGPTPTNPSELEGYVQTFLRSTEGLGDNAFLRAQFDAGLAWVHYRIGDGGLGLPRACQLLVDELLERDDRRLDWRRNPMGIGMFSPALTTFGTPEQRQHLRPIFAADELWCQLFSEPGCGSDLAGLSTRAVSDGDQWIVNGQKTWTSWAEEAHQGLLLVRTDPAVPKHEGLSAFMVDMSSPGIETRPLRELTGATTYFSDVFFTDVSLPSTSMLGRPGDGWRVAITMLMNERVAVAGEVEGRGTGTIGDAVEAWRHHDDRDAVERDRLTSLWCRAEALRLVKLRVAESDAFRHDPGPTGSLLKLAAAELEQALQQFLLDISGPVGTLAYDYAQPDGDDDSGGRLAPFLDSISRTIAGGTSEVMRNILGERILGLPRDSQPDRDLPWNAVARNDTIVTRGADRP